jgi:hypothetical protein
MRLTASPEVVPRHVLAEAKAETKAEAVEADEAEEEVSPELRFELETCRRQFLAIRNTMYAIPPPNFDPKKSREKLV